MQDQQVDVLIIGAGPTGLGAAKRLHDLVYFPFFPWEEMGPVKWADMVDRNIAIGLLSMHSKRLEDLRPRT